MHARITTVEGQPDRIDDAIERVKSDVQPILEGQDGFEGFTLHADRSSGKLVGVSYWESEEAMQASEEAVRSSRDQVAESGGAAGGPSVDFFEVVVDTMK